MFICFSDYKANDKNAALTKLFSDKVKAAQEKNLPKTKVEVNKNN